MLCISTAASTIGAISGIGGGIIIKPLLDAFGIFDISAASFLSGCTVLSMSLFSVISSQIKKTSKVDLRTSSLLALGAVIGGTAGKFLFQAAGTLFPSSSALGFVQSAILMSITVFTIVYTVFQKKIKTHKIKNPILCCIIGTVLGMLSSFLGIGGGPLNLVVLFFFFSMDTKTAAENSLYIVLFSQFASLISSAATGSIPHIQLSALIIMAAGGVGGGILGRYINKRIATKTVNKLFIAIMLLIICICAYNLFSFT